MKKILALVLTLVMLTATAVAWADGITEVVGGRLGRFTWTLDLDDGILMIRGSGELTGEDPMPWQEHEDQIKMVLFEDGITSIPDGFLAGCVNMTTIYFPANIAFIGSGVPSVSNKIKVVGFSGEIETLLDAMQDEADRAVINSLGVKYATFNGEKYEFTLDGEKFSVTVDENGNIQVKTDNGYSAWDVLKWTKTLTEETTLADGTILPAGTIQKHYSFKMYDDKGKDLGTGTADEYTYPNGDQRTVQNFDSGMVVTSTSSKAENKSTERIQYNGTDENLSEWYVEYEGDDTSSRTVEEKTITRDNTVTVTKYDYDEEGKQYIASQEQTATEADGTQQYILVTYAPDGDLKSQNSKTTYTDGRTAEVVYEYDDDGKFKSVMYTWRDENGDRTGMQQENADGSKAVASYSDDKLAQVHYYNADGSETIKDYVPGTNACRRYEQKNADGSGYIVIYDTATNTQKTYTQVGVPGDDGTRINIVWDWATLTLLSLEEEYADGSKVITYYDSNRNITGFAITGIPDANGVAHYTFYDQNAQATGEEGYYDNCGNVVLLDVDTEMSLSEAAPCVEEDLTLEAEIWPMPMEEETAEEEPVAEEPVEYEAEEEPVADEPATEEEPVAEEEAATEEEPVATDEPATEEEPVAEEEPATEEPVAEEEPAGEEDAA